MSLQKTFLGLLLWFVPFTLSAQRTVSGHITDAEDGELVPGVSVFIAGTTVGMVTDSAGRYRLTIPGEGSYRLVVSHAGYQPVFKDIEPGQASVTLNAVLQIRELDEVEVTAKIKFRKEDIKLFWNILLGKDPSKKTIFATNPEEPFFYYNPKTKILKVTCRNPLHITNLETGYDIELVLERFTHDYNIQTSFWNYQYMFKEIEPRNFKQKNTWEKNREKVYRVSITNLIKALYSDSQAEKGFLLSPVIDISHRPSGRSDLVLMNLNNFLYVDSVNNLRTLYVPPDSFVLLVCFGKPVTVRDTLNLCLAQNGFTKFDFIGSFRNRLETPDDSVYIFPDGTFKNTLKLSRLFSSKPITGLNMMLPIEYGLEELRVKSEELRTKSEELRSGNTIADSLENVAKRFDKQLRVFSQEKVYLQTDKPYYLAGERIWFRAHVVDAALHLPDLSANCVFAELFDARDSVVSRVKVGYENEAFSGYFSIPENLPEGNYTLRAYTNWMREMDEDYFFMKTVHIINLSPPLIQTAPSRKQTRQKQTKTPLPDDDFDVSFYPEGGYALVDCMGRIAFKAMQRNGTAIDVSVTVYDSEGNEFTRVKTDVRGMGLFTLKPKPSEKYYAVCTDSKGQSKRFDLPAAKEKGYTLSATWNKDRLIVQANHAPARSDTLCLLVHTRGVVQDIRILENPDVPVAFPKDFFPSGVSNLLLLDRNMLPLSERLVFVYNDDQAKVSCSTDSNTYSPRNPVELTINLTDESGEPLQGNVSVAVTDDGEVAVDTTSNILTSLLLTSDLRGNIFDPAFYFQKTAHSSWASDLLMLTQGWRRYDTERIVRNDFQYSDSLLGKGYEISGTVTKAVTQLFNPKIIPADNIDVNMISVNGEYYANTRTDSAGRFYLYDGNARDSTWFIVKAGEESNRDKLELTLDTARYPGRLISANALFSPDPEVLAKYADKADRQYLNEHGARLIQLKEVTVQAKKRPERKSTYYFTPDRSLTEEQLSKRPPASSLTALLSLVGVFYRADDPGRKYMQISGPVGKGPAMILIDDVPQQVTPDGSAFDWVYVDDIARIDVLTSPTNLAAFGKDGENGAVAIYTRRGGQSAPTETPYIKKIMPLGFQTPVEFYAPKYDSIRIDSKPDLRTTIHWQPTLSTDEAGKASFQFYTADTPSTYSVVIEGVTDTGKIVYKREKIKMGGNYSGQICKYFSAHR